MEKTLNFIPQKIEIYLRGNREYTKEEYDEMDKYAIANFHSHTRYITYLQLRELI